MKLTICSTVLYLLAFTSCHIECSKDRHVTTETRSIAQDDVRVDGGNAGILSSTDHMDSRLDGGEADTLLLADYKDAQMHRDDKGTPFFENYKHTWAVEGNRYTRSSERHTKWTDKHSKIFQSYKRSSAIGKSIQKREVNTDQRGETAGTADDDFFKEILKLIETNCPGEGVCTAENANGPKLHNTKCCLNCRCRKACKRTGSCCANMQTTRDDNFLYIPAVNAKCIRPSLTIYGKYEFFTSCPETSSREEKAKCEFVAAEGENHNVTDAEMLPIFDRVRLTNYWNIYCAVCNGASMENLAMWLQQYSCMRSESNGEEACTPAIIPPEEPDIDFTRCYSDYDVISTCNETGQWKIYDPFLDEACRHLHLHYAVTVGGNRVVTRTNRFQNIFCAFCNGIGITPPSWNCSARNDFVVPFTTIIRHSLPLEKLPGQILGCGPSKKMDPISGRCKEVTCSYPLVWDSHQEQCVDMVFFGKGLYDITFSVKFNSNTDWSSLTLFKNYLEAKFAAINNESTLCGFEMHVKMNTPFIDLEFNTPLEQLSFSAITDAYVIVYISESLLATTAEKAKLSYGYFKDAFANFRRNTNQQTVSEQTTYKANDTQDTYERKYIAGFSLDTFDPWTLLPISDPRVTTMSGSAPVTPSEIRRKRQADWWFAYGHIYDGFTMIRPRYITKNYYKDYSDNCNSMIYPKAYDRSFISCPTFEYELTDHTISRCPYGIELRGRDVKFGFEEFRSVNETHVRICVANVLEKVVSSGMATRYSIPYGVMAAVGATVGTYVVSVM